MTGNVFEFAIAPNAFIDAVRYMTLIVGFWVFCAALHRLLNHRLFWSAWNGIALGIFTSVQELTVLGEPFYPWRLFLLVVMNVSCGIYLYRGEDHVSR